MYPLLCFLLLLSFGFILAPSFGGCLSFLPYGYNNFFVHLPADENFCVSSSDGDTTYKTDSRGARIIAGKKSEVPVHAFGESQLLEIFPNTRGNGHALRTLYNKKTILIHGAPNNGPFETVEYLKYVLRTTTPEYIVIGLNFGTDIFRIIPGWKTKNYVSLTSDELPTVMTFPFWYEIKTTLGMLKGMFFTSKKINVHQIREKYFSKKQKIRENFKGFIYKLNEETKSLNSKIDFIFFPPYWMYTQKEKTSYLEERIGTEFHNFVCDVNILDPLYVTQAYIAKFPKILPTDKLFTFDGRHFKTEFLTFEPRDSYCSNY